MDGTKKPGNRLGKSHEAQQKAASDLKMMHREIEKQRRQEMSNLYSSLRSLLPAEYIKGKRSISEHMNEAVNYINHLQEKIKQMEAKMEKLRSITGTSSADLDAAGGSSSSNWLPSSVTVSPCYGGMEVLIVNGSEGGGGGGGGGGGFCLSRVLRVLVEQGINVVTCLSSQVNGRLIHTIRTEVNEVMHIDLLLLQHQLDLVINDRQYGLTV